MIELLDFFISIGKWLINFYIFNLWILNSLALIISGIALFFIIYLSHRMRVVSSKTEKYKEYVKGVDVFKLKMNQEWQKVLKRLKIDGDNQLRAAISSCDRILFEILKEKDISGKSMDERIDNLTQEHVSNLSELLKANQVSERINKKEELILTSDEARNIVKIYQQAFKELGLF